MFSNKYKNWKTKLSELDELFGREPRYPLAAVENYISNEINNQNDIIRNANNELANNISASTDAICGTLNLGFDRLIETNTNGLEQISENIEKLDSSLMQISTVLNWGFTQVKEQIQISNVLLENIAEILKIAEFEKESEAYIKEGLKFFHNARFNSKRYNDAYKCFKIAEEITDRNYFLLQKIGLIHLYSKNHLDIDLALKYFLKSSDYSYDETFLTSSKTFNTLKINSKIGLNDQVPNVLGIKNITAYSFLYAARCYYIKKDLDQALKHAEKANELCPTLIDVKYDMAKYLCCIGQINKSIKILNELLEKDFFIALKINTDIDFLEKEQITNFLKNYRDNQSEIIKILLTSFDKITFGRNYIDESKKLFKEQNIISLGLAKLILEKKHETTIQTVKFDKHNKIQIINQSSSWNLKDLNKALDLNAILESQISKLKLLENQINSKNSELSDLKTYFNKASFFSKMINNNSAKLKNITYQINNLIDTKENLENDIKALSNLINPFIFNLDVEIVKFLDFGMVVTEINEEDTEGLLHFSRLKRTSKNEEFKNHYSIGERLKVRKYFDTRIKRITYAEIL